VKSVKDLMDFLGNSTNDDTYEEQMKGEEEELPYLEAILKLSTTIYTQMEAGVPANSTELQKLRVKINQEEVPLMQVHLNQLSIKQVELSCVVSNTTAACA
jgi:hypothetical protein